MELDAIDVNFFNVDFQASFFTVFFHPQSRGSLTPVATTGLSEIRRLWVIKKGLSLALKLSGFHSSRSFVFILLPSSIMRRNYFYSDYNIEVGVENLSNFLTTPFAIIKFPFDVSPVEQIILILSIAKKMSLSVCKVHIMRQLIY